MPAPRRRPVRARPLEHAARTAPPSSGPRARSGRFSHTCLRGVVNRTLASSGSGRARSTRQTGTRPAANPWWRRERPPRRRASSALPSCTARELQVAVHGLRQPVDLLDHGVRHARASGSEPPPLGGTADDRERVLISCASVAVMRPIAARFWARDSRRSSETCDAFVRITSSASAANAGSSPPRQRQAAPQPSSQPPAGTSSVTSTAPASSAMRAAARTSDAPRWNGGTWRCVRTGAHDRMTASQPLACRREEARPHRKGRARV